MIAVSVVVILGGGWLLLRDSALVRVDRVEISGLTGSDAAQIRAALDDAARSMTTLHYDRRELLDAVAAHPIVRDIEVQRSLPHTLRIRVVPREPVAAISAGGSRVAVASDGALLRGTKASELPAIRVTLPPRGERISDTATQAALRLLTTAPVALARRITEVNAAGGQLTARLRGGPLLRFGSAERIAAKWIAVRQVLRDPIARRAAYIDLRIPERPAAGGLSETDGGAPTPAAAISTMPDLPPQP
ncbi:unannotated protein [freshwater metagenome]|uniref:Unannotated protein n=1 Tax=freshwater metagenome TaxID=449393 RepID=A0A6J7DQ02_9ZZZZ|nr:FtsQ-type POTRA domain-containing protein [Actinomycetota bacterium]